MRARSLFAMFMSNFLKNSLLQKTSVQKKKKKKSIFIKNMSGSDEKIQSREDEMKSLKMIFIGLVCEDIIARVSEFPKEDTKTRADPRQEMTRGGNAANSATEGKNDSLPIMLFCCCKTREKVVALLGHDNVDFMGALPSKQRSRLVLEDLKKNGVGTSLCMFDEEKDEISTSWIILSTKNNSRTVINFPRGAFELPVSHVKDTLGQVHANVQLIHFEGRWVANMCEMMAYLCENENTQHIHISIEIEKERPLREGSIFVPPNKAALTACDNTATVQTEAKQKKEQDKNKEEKDEEEQFVDRLIPFGNVIFFSKQLVQGRGFANPNDFLLYISKRFSHKFVKLKSNNNSNTSRSDRVWLVLPWGEVGAYGLEVDSHLSEQTHSVLFVKSYPPPKIATTLGAGDVFNGAFLFAYTKQWELYKCLDFACQVAGFKVGFDTFQCVKQFQYINTR
ncbi:Ketohexokinase [Reticulomyxa filosa]|uniref:Ketohexokinase n=1 Tax=Reticulomyxa filosa TaxID=46433 RepID=X6LZD0_RETFI|nr:Ketohexokinase [Reticulomyxa filosa]|eukprot:ETO07283.1 Ketohexokinase [Reticulomyxa filosa]